MRGMKERTDNLDAAAGWVDDRADAEYARGLAKFGIIGGSEFKRRTDRVGGKEYVGALRR
jgi:hypothetical protein